MDWEENQTTVVDPEVVDPEVRAYVYSLVSALGGTGADEEGRYVLGDDALACLKDLKKWLNLYDEKANRLDVARCLAEANLVGGDLLPILAAWPEQNGDEKAKGKVALACLELLVPLTWPIEKSDERMTVNHHRHVPYLQLAQTSYKKAILEHEPANVLRNAVRVGLPSMALSPAERAARDEGIIKLLLYFFRNIAMIVPSHNAAAEDQISRSTTIEAFHNQDVLALLLTISSNMGEDFNNLDTVIMEVLFHLLKGIDVQKLFMDKAQLNKKSTDELQSLLSTEKNMHRDYAKIAPTRHNRFGTMIWVKRDDARVSTVSGQDVLNNNQRTLLKMDQSKKWNKMKPRSKDTEPANDRFDLPVPLSELASTHLRAFVEEFLDSSFNPLFNHIRKAIEREAERVLESHSQQFFYLVSWFLEAERLRRRKRREDENTKKKKIMEDFDADSFALVASVLNQETFIALNRFMQDRLDNKMWREVIAGTRCFTQILFIVQEMAASPLEEDQEIAENIQNRIFYEETTHDRILAILRGYKDQGFAYLDACTELSQVFLRMLERYSKENLHLQIRSRQRARVKRKAAAASQAGTSAENGDDDASEMEEVAVAERESKERQFDFRRFSAKFVSQGCVNTFVAFTKYYQDLNPDQLKRAHRFFYRVAFKQELSVMLFRVDNIALFNRLIKGPDGLDPKNPMFKEWEELVRQLFRRLSKKLQQRPELFVEMLFSKIHASVFYLENDYEKETTTSKPRAPATLEVKGAMTKNEQIGVLVAVLHGNLDMVDWVAKVLSSAANERQSWEAEAAGRQLLNDADKEQESSAAENPSRPPSIVVVPTNEELRIAMFKNNKLRLLMTLAGFERVGIEDEPDATWIIPSILSAKELHETHESILKHRDNPIMEYGDDDDPVKAEDMLRRVSSSSSSATTKPRRAAYDDDSDSDGIINDDDDAEEEFLFPAGGPTNRKSSALEELKRKHNKRKRRCNDEDDEAQEQEEGEGESADELTLAAKRKARAAADLERRRKIKSNQFVRGSDEESDEELDRRFFEREEMIRKGQSGKAMQAAKAAALQEHVGKGTRSSSRDGDESRKRKRKMDKDGGRKENAKAKRSKLDDSFATAGAEENDDLNHDEDDNDISSTPTINISFSAKATDERQMPEEQVRQACSDDISSTPTITISSSAIATDERQMPEEQVRQASSDDETPTPLSSPPPTHPHLDNPDNVDDDPVISLSLSKPSGQNPLANHTEALQPSAPLPDRQPDRREDINDPPHHLASSTSPSPSPEKNKTPLIDSVPSAPLPDQDELEDELEDEDEGSDSNEDMNKSESESESESESDPEEIEIFDHDHETRAILEEYKRNRKAEEEEKEEVEEIRREREREKEMGGGRGRGRGRRRMVVLDDDGDDDDDDDERW